MRIRSLSTATVLAVLAGSAALGFAATGTATAATPVTVTSPAGIAVDGALNRVFVGDSSTGTVRAGDWNGNQVGSVSGITGVADVAASADGATVYAASPATHEIVSIDAATLAVEHRYPVATNEGPTYVAFAGGKLWFSYGDQWDANLGSVDPTAADAGSAVALGQFPHTGPGLWNPALLDANPGAPGLLAVADSGLSTDSVGVVDVSGATPQLTAWKFGDYSIDNGVSDIDLVPGASQVLLDGTDRVAYANGTLTREGSYPSGQRAAVSHDGLVAQVTGRQIAVYQPDATTPLRTYAPNTTGLGDLAWAPDDSRLFALVGQGVKDSWWPSSYTLQALTGPTLSVPTLSVKAPGTAARAKQLTVTGRMTAAIPLPAGTALHVTRTDLLSPSGKALPSVTVKADGSFAFSDVPPSGGTVTYTVSYAGDAQHAAVSASGKVGVSRTATALSLVPSGKVYSYGRRITFTAHLGASYQNRTVEIWADPYGADKPSVRVRIGRVDAHGNISVPLTLTRDTRITAIYRGDSRSAPRSVAVTAYDQVAIGLSVSHYYRTGRIGSTGYYWFHKRSDAYLTTTMTYYKGRAQRLDVQVWSRGRWYTADPQFFPLAPNGRSLVRLTAPGQAGFKVRVRAVYADGASGDNVNTTTYGSWKYIYFSN